MSGRPGEGVGAGPDGHEIVVAAYDTPAHAELAIQDLLVAGLPEDDVGRHVAEGGAPVEPGRQGFWARLLGGGTPHGEALYDRTVAEGGTVVVAIAPSARADEVVRILGEHAPVDLDERAARHAAVAPADLVPPAFSPGLLDLPFDTSLTAGALDAAAVGRAASLFRERRLHDRGDGRVRRFVETEEA